jgi:thiol:disulfide interchange protein
MLVFWSAAISAQEGIRFMDGSLAAIMSLAKKRNENVFIDTYADWCVPCKRIEGKFKNKDVAMFFNEHFINYRVNMQNPTRSTDLRRK